MSVKISREEIVTILRLVEQSACCDFELTIGDTSLRLRKQHVAPAPADGLPATTQAALKPAISAAAPAPAQDPPPSPAKPRELVQGFQLKAPMLGIFYRAPSPGAPSFVEVGDHVEVGTTLCIIEVMKVMNTVKSDRAGVIAAVYPENAAMVEFGETIMVIGAEAVA